MPPHDGQGSKRALARRMARDYLKKKDPLGWFEALYCAAHGDSSAIPWADLRPNPHLSTCLDNHPSWTRHKTALVIGCGLGDDAEELASRGCRVWAFDISSTAIQWCRRRFPDSKVTYVVADLFTPSKHWIGAFDLVIEAYTLQVLPPKVRRKAVPAVSAFASPGGVLIVVSRGRNSGEDPGQMPWPLTKSEIREFGKYGMLELDFRDFYDDEEPPVRRFLVTYERSREETRKGSAGA